jgi:hypothetical protein
MPTKFKVPKGKNKGLADMTKKQIGEFAKMPKKKKK